MNPLKVWAPNASSVELIRSDRTSFTPSVMLEGTTTNINGQDIRGYWETPEGANTLSDGDGYWFKLTTPSGVIVKPDPYARAMQYDTTYSIYKDPNAFEWTDGAHQPQALETMVIYQIFPGGYAGRNDQSWVDAQGHNYGFQWNCNGKKGDFVQLRKKLDYIQSLGVNTIELLPINEDSGADTLGYDSVNWFSIESSYGPVEGDGSSYDALKAFINDAHGRGISVIADLVFNHIGNDRSTGFLDWFDSAQNPDAATNIYIGAPREDTSNGTAPDWARWEVQKYIEDACYYFLRELHFDGLRFDLTAEITNKRTDRNNNSGLAVLTRIIQGIRNSPDTRNKVLMCEHWDYSAYMIDTVGFHAGWFNFRRDAVSTLSAYSQDASGLENAINGGSYPHPHSRVVYANNHDECWWDGSNAPNKFWPITQFDTGNLYWAQKKARLMCSLSFFIPGVPLFFMGDEFAMTGCFNDARKANIPDWALETGMLGQQFKAMFIRLISIRKTYSQLTDTECQFEWIQKPQNEWFAFKRKAGASALIVAGNWSGDNLMNFSVPTNGEIGQWSQIFNSDGEEYGGDGAGNYLNTPETVNDCITINIPKNGIVVMNRVDIWKD